MKHLILFEKYNNKDLQSNVKAALVELEDLGFKIKLDFYLNDDKPVGWFNQSIEVIISKPIDSKLQPFTYSEISDTINTLIEYVSEMGFTNKKWKVYAYHKRSSPNWQSIATYRHSEPIDNLIILDIELKLSENNLREL